MLQQLGIPTSPASEHIRIRNGGPVETGRGFVLHTADYRDDATLNVGDTVGLTATLDILRDIAAGQGPKRSLLALGYAGWGPGQLDSEIQSNAWLCVPADDELIFDDKLDRQVGTQHRQDRRRFPPAVGRSRERLGLSTRVPLSGVSIQFHR